MSMPAPLATSQAEAARKEVRRQRIERRRRVVLWAIRRSAFGERDIDTAHLLNMSATNLSGMFSREMRSLNCTTRTQMFVKFLRIGALTGDDFKACPTVDEIRADIK